MAEQNSGDGVLAFMLGSVFGAALGLLLAPARGEETRKRLLEWLEKNRELTKGTWEAGRKAYHEEGGDSH